MGQAFPDPFTWILGAALVILFGWLIERSGKRSARTQVAASRGDEQSATPGDGERAIFEKIQSVWHSLTDGETAHIVSSSYKPDHLAMRVWEDHFVFSELTRTSDGWVALLNIHVSQPISMRHADLLSSDLSWSPQAAGEAFFFAVGEDAAHKIEGSE